MEVVHLRLSTGNDITSLSKINICLHINVRVLLFRCIHTRRRLASGAARTYGARLKMESSTEHNQFVHQMNRKV
jgi:hypothetical protein